MWGVNSTEIDARPTALHCIGEKALWGVPGQAKRLGCVGPPPFSLYARLAPHTPFPWRQR